MVKGIDNQVMIHRTAEYARQTAARNDRAENEKAFAAQMEQQRAVQDMQSVSETERIKSKRVSREKSGNEGLEESEKGEDDRGETEEESEFSKPNALGHEIDITV